MIKKSLPIIALLLLISASSFSQEKVEWTSIEDADKLIKEKNKAVFIDAYTDWCGWCKKLDKDTFSHPVIAEYLNKNFISVKFNAESNSPVTFMGNDYINDGKAGKAHQLAVALLQGQMSYPTVAFLNKDGEYLGPVAGYKTAKEFEPFLVFIAEEKYTTQKYEEFLKTFEGKVK